MKIAVLGAGLVGSYIGGSLIASGGDVVLIGRQRMANQIARSGLSLSDLDGRSLTLTPDRVYYDTDPASLTGCKLILLTVKSADTASAAKLIDQFADRDALMISFQNGVGNVDLLRNCLPDHVVLAGMVPFNVATTADGALHRGTEGALMVEASPALDRWLTCFATAGLAVQQRTDIVAVQWGKLLLNLNNSVNALADQPLRQQLSQRGYRQALALMIDEALIVLRQAGIRPAKLGRVAPGLLPLVLRLPDFLFSRVASAMLRIDPLARSSMWEDLASGRATEIDYLNGALVRLAAASGISAATNARMVQLVHAAEQGGQRSWLPEQLLDALR